MPQKTYLQNCKQSQSITNQLEGSDNLKSTSLQETATVHVKKK